MTLISAIKSFFGLKPGETLTEFREEVRTLSEQDKVDLSGMLTSEGYNIDPPQTQPAAQAA